jgi:hypothetical protein
MPTPYGPQAIPYPQPSEAPDGPGAFLALLQKMDVGGIIPYTTFASLPATGFLGQHATVTSDANNNGDYWWNGSGWVRPGAQRLFLGTFADTSYSNGNLIGNVVNIPAIPTASRVLITLTGMIGFSGTANIDVATSCATTGGGIVADQQGAFATRIATAATWASYSHVSVMDTPASTAATVSHTMVIGGGASAHFAGILTCQVLLPGEY